MKVLKEILPYIIIVLVIILIRLFIITPVKVVGDSMLPTLKAGEVLMLSKDPFIGKKIYRFDIVVIKYNNETIIKRVIGLPGESIEYLDNTLYVDGEIVKEKFKHGKTEDFSSEDLTGIEKVPDDSYFVLGDNREVSMDSRIIGYINKKDIVGKVSLRLFPIKSFGFVE